MRKNDYISEAELRMLLGRDCGEDEPSGLLDADDRRLLHALVRNQLRQLHMIEELQSEIRMMRSALEMKPIEHQETAAALDPLPFMRAGRSPGGANDDREEEQQETPSAIASRKERFKRKTLWRKE